MFQRLKYLPDKAVLQCLPQINCLSAAETEVYMNSRLFFNNKVKNFMIYNDYIDEYLNVLSCECNYKQIKGMYTCTLKTFQPAFLSHGWSWIELGYISVGWTWSGSDFIHACGF